MLRLEARVSAVEKPNKLLVDQNVNRDVNEQLENSSNMKQVTRRAN